MCINIDSTYYDICDYIILQMETKIGIQMIKLLVIYPIHDGMKVIIKIEMKVKVTLLEI